ncbi:MAG TPA: hypothetical protein VHM24_00660, partial [Gemmatimonadaceae bacterium]|nr:hypothetical protein [Gemmatimonadaceae bacterium]
MKKLVTSTAWAILTAALAVASCAPPPPSTPITTQAGPSASVTETETGGMFQLSEQGSDVTVGLRAPADSVWVWLPKVYQKLGIPTDYTDVNALVIGTRAFKSSRLDGRRTADYVRCGNQGAGPSSGGMYHTNLSILSSVRAIDSVRASLTTLVNGIASPVEGTSTGNVSCVSNGLLERRIRALL